MKTKTGMPSSLKYGLVFFVLSQVLLELFLPLSLVYNYRIDYNIIKDNLTDINRVLDRLKLYIQRNGIEDYIIIIGDSVAYSGPGGPLQSVSYYMNQISREKSLPPVFNLAIPAAQMGDFYTLLLMLDERGISTDKVIINLLYAGFVKRDPDPPVVYWLERELKRLDPVSYAQVADALLASNENKNRPDPFETFLEEYVYNWIPVLRYRDFLRAGLFKVFGAYNEVTGDTRPWYEKPYLKSLLQDPVYKRQFDPAPFALDDSNPNVFFLKRIAEHQRGKSLLLFMSPINRELMAEEVAKPGFLQNFVSLNDFLKDLASEYSFVYRDLSNVVPARLFSDHLHLVSEGYRYFAGILWKEILNSGILHSSKAACRITARYGVDPKLWILDSSKATCPLEPTVLRFYLFWRRWGMNL